VFPSIEASVDEANMDTEISSEMTKADDIARKINEMEVKKLQLMMKLEQDQKLYIQLLPKVKKELASIEAEIIRFQQVLSDGPQIRRKIVYHELKEMNEALSRMKETKSLLKDADNWNTVKMEVESFLAAKDYEKTARRLNDARKSLEMLSVSFNFESRKELLEQLTHKFLDLIKDEFSKAVNVTNNIGEARNIAMILESLQYDAFLSNHYFEMRSQHLTQHWSVNDSMTEGIIKFLEEMTQIIPNEFVVIEGIFEDPNTKLNELIHFIFSKLQPSFEKILEDVSNRKNAILDLIVVYNACKQFGAILEQTYPVKSSANVWGASLFQKFIPYQKRFEYFEKQLIDSLLSELLQRNLNLKELATMTFSILNDSKKRYLQFTNGLVSVNMHALHDNILIRTANHFLSLIQSYQTWSGTGPNSQIKFVVPEDYERKFQQQIEGLREVTGFIRTSNQYWESIQSEPSTWSAQSLDGNTCESSLIPLKTLHRDFRIHEQTETQAHDAMSKLLVVAQNNVLESLIAPIRSFFMNLPSIPIWQQNESEEKFSLSPSSYITCIGEHLLTLAHLFDPYIQEEALAYHIQSLPHCDPTLLKAEELDVTFLWIYSSIKLTERIFLDQVFEIRSLSTFGAKQLIADLEYLKNVMAALDIPTDFELEEALIWMDRSLEELAQEESRAVAKKLLLMKTSSPI
jgi:hypothetical protein